MARHNCKPGDKISLHLHSAMVGGDRDVIGEVIRVTATKQVTVRTQDRGNVRFNADGFEILSKGQWSSQWTTEFEGVKCCR